MNGKAFVLSFALLNVAHHKAVPFGISAHPDKLRRDIGYQHLFFGYGFNLHGRLGNGIGLGAAVCGGLPRTAVQH